MTGSQQTPDQFTADAACRGRHHERTLGPAHVELPGKDNPPPHMPQNLWSSGR